MRQRASGRGGFTLIELLVVIIIMVIILGSVAAIFGLMFRGGGLRQGGYMLSTALNTCKYRASNNRTTHFLDLSLSPDKTGMFQIIIDDDPASPNVLASADRRIDKPMDLPKGITFGLTDGASPNSAGYPDWIMITSTGYVRYPPSGPFNISIGKFEADYAAAVNSGGTASGDVILHPLGRSYKLYCDVNEISAAVRKTQFLDK
jgi:prepilin-type N-terminal cleavage/methylation domain-containing protein